MRKLEALLVLLVLTITIWDRDGLSNDRLSNALGGALVEEDCYHNTTANCPTTTPCNQNDCIPQSLGYPTYETVYNCPSDLVGKENIQPTFDNVSTSSTTPGTVGFEEKNPIKCSKEKACKSGRHCIEHNGRQVCTYVDGNWSQTDERTPRREDGDACNQGS